MECYKVTCKDESGNTYDVGVMTTGREAAMRSAEKSILEGRHIKATAVKAEDAEGI